MLDYNDNLPTLPAPILIKDCDDSDRVIELGEGMDRGYEDSAGSSPSTTGRRLVWLFRAAVGLVLFWVYCQVVPLLRLVLECHGWRFVVAFVMLLLPITLIAYAFLRLWGVERKLKNFAQVDEAGQSEAKTAEELRSDYLTAFPDIHSYVRSIGLKDTNMIKDVEELLKSLSDKESNFSDETGWIGTFKEFQLKQDKIANGIVRHYAVLIALKTAASPWRIVDMASVMFNTTLMIADIGKVYMRKISRGNAFILLCHWFLNLYVSGELQSVAENVTQKSVEKIQETVNAHDLFENDEVLSGVVNNVMPWLGKLAGKVAEGGANAYLAHRMGRRAIAYFQALKVNERQ